MLRAAGKKVFFVTNNSTKSRKGYLGKFKSLGLEAEREREEGGGMLDLAHTPPPRPARRRSPRRSSPPRLPPPPTWSRQLQGPLPPALALPSPSPPLAPHPHLRHAADQVQGERQEGVHHRRGWHRGGARHDRGAVDRRCASALAPAVPASPAVAHALALSSSRCRSKCRHGHTLPRTCRPPLAPAPPPLRHPNISPPAGGSDAGKKIALKSGCCPPRGADRLVSCALQHRRSTRLQVRAAARLRRGRRHRRL